MTELKRLTFSHSALNDYKNCPLSYYHKRVIKDVPDIKGEQAMWGERVHKHLELRVSEGTPLPPELVHFEPHIAKFAEYETKTEWKTCLNETLKPTGFFDPDAWLRCIIDLYVRVAPDAAVVVDYKSGKRKNDTSQLEMCALMVFAHEPEVQEVRAAYFWLPAKAIDPVVYRREDANVMWETVISTIRRVYRSVEHDSWPAKASGLCNWCGYQPHCSYGRRK